ncbi:MAG: hypothetical protein M3P95_12670 [Actinomycetota bacterium]|jgi:uncharacterized protein with PIN domain|nr:hypothetical protein [Actinomycetota bacterium]
MSLVTTPESTLDRCVACNSPRVTSITMTLTDGSQVQFTSCHKCEHKSWVQAGRTIELDSVITRAQKKK